MTNVVIRPGERWELEHLDIEQTRQFLRHDLASDLVAEQTAAAGAREEAGR